MQNVRIFQKLEPEKVIFCDKWCEMVRKKHSKNILYEYNIKQNNIDTLLLDPMSIWVVNLPSA